MVTIVPACFVGKVAHLEGTVAVILEAPIGGARDPFPSSVGSTRLAAAHAGERSVSTYIPGIKKFCNTLRLSGVPARAWIRRLGSTGLAWCGIAGPPRRDHIASREKPAPTPPPTLPTPPTHIETQQIRRFEAKNTAHVGGKTVKTASRSVNGFSVRTRRALDRHAPTMIPSDGSARTGIRSTRDRAQNDLAHDRATRRGSPDPGRSSAATHTLPRAAQPTWSACSWSPCSSRSSAFSAWSRAWSLTGNDTTATDDMACHPDKAAPNRDLPSGQFTVVGDRIIVLDACRRTRRPDDAVRFDDPDAGQPLSASANSGCLADILMRSSAGP